MAQLAYQPISQDGDAVTPVAATVSGDTILHDKRGFLWVKNASGATITATVVVPGTEYGQARADIAVSVPAGSDRFVGPLVLDLADTDGLIDVTYSAVTSVTVAAVRLPS